MSTFNFDSEENYLFFWRPNADQPNAWASQWYPSSFTSTITFPALDLDASSVHFPTAEHWMAFQKALLFGDADVAQSVLNFSNTHPRTLATIKSLGRSVQNFDEDKWNAQRERIVLEGNLLKFGQNSELWELLDGTGDKILAEASPYDSIWGVGFTPDHAFENRADWGLNLLGQALMETRKVLREEKKRKQGSE
ncbi:DUF1768-domain-containing protein [Cylindrobasidium torrendii FP15055 ss-10]|uniref:DUF1768-domain-containing protein n=1 Tax=Cylindrobasidium torrendii FP15055 ss-10 TaxID=1314674 RepID=A0A0D7BKV4_9AGAR|nr:DUF1768-domain-containing protein [Cylindrobasidium torrendii FP15055 ss-10]